MKRTIIVQSIDSAIAIPGAGSADDPRCGTDPAGTVKAHITVASASTGQSHISALVCDNWIALGSDTTPTGYKYRDPELDDGTVRTLVWKDGTLLKAVFKGQGAALLDYDLQIGVDQDVVDVDVHSGQTRLCLACTGDNGRDGSDGRRFRGGNASCSVPPQCTTATVDARIDLLIQRAEAAAPECDLVAKGTLGGEARGWYYDVALAAFRSDRAAETPLSDAQLRQIGGVVGQPLTYTCMPLGSGVRNGVDRDGDGVFDRDELDAGSNPADPASMP